MTKIFYSLSEWKNFRHQEIFTHKTIGLVPTMGNLHRGHESLLIRSVQENDITVLTLFVNPTQFNDKNDLINYPRTLEQDIKMAKDAGVDFILCPEYSEIYPDNYRYKINESEFSQMLCGQFREGHFDGVLTIVMKLFQIVQPHKAYFGEKDYQQLQLVKDMVEAFFLNMTIVPCPTIRDSHGLALSSRNNRLTPQQMIQAQQFPKLLAQALSTEEISDKLTKLGFLVDYITEHSGRRFGAVKLGEVRLIDNIKISETQP